MARLSDYDRSTAFKAKVVSNERITAPASKEEVRNIELELVDGQLSFVEGQSVGVIVPGPHEHGVKEHFRLYSIASTRQGENGNASTISLCVRRCFYIDDYSGEEYKGIASNYLCDLGKGDEITLTGPYGRAFVVPGDKTCNLLMVGMGTGIAPYRAFVKHIYETKGGWEGQVRLFYGASTGMELLYMNNERDDFGQYYDEKTFKAFKALSPRPALGADVALDKAIEENAGEVWSLLQDPKTYVFVAGLEKAGEQFDKAMSRVAGSPLQWEQKKNEIKGANRWFELLY